jgi:phage terminase large subunit
MNLCWGLDVDTISAMQAQILMQRAQTDPKWFCKAMLGADLWKVQVAIAESTFTNRYTSVVACHAPGKTFLAAQLALNFLYAFHPSKVITTAPTNRQVESLLWSEIREAHARSGKIRPLGGDPLRKRLELGPNWYAEGFASSEYDPERTQGYHSPNILIIVDEASGVADPIFDSLEGLMSSGNAHMLLIGNPNRGEGRFFESFSLPTYAKFRISAFDTPNFQYFGISRNDLIDGSWEEKVKGKSLPRPYLVSPEWAAERFAVWGHDSLLVRTRVDAEFPTGDESDKVIPVSYLDYGEQDFPEDEKGSMYELGVDIARYGTDESVIAVRCGRQSIMEKVIHQKSTMNIVGAVREIVHKLQPHRVSRIKLDVIGLGSGPVDRLREQQDAGEFPQHIDVMGVNVAMKPRNPKRFVNQRDELWWQFRTELSESKISTRGISAEAQQEFVLPTYSITSKGQIKVEAKDDLRKAGRLGRSPDRADAWLLCYGDCIPEKGGRRGSVRAISVGRR